MGIKETFEKLGEKSKARKEMIRQLDERVRIQKIVEDRQKSANERELERFMEEDREERIKEQLEMARKKRSQDIRFNHNPLDVPNITNKTDWEVLKERNLFKKQKSMFVGQPSVLKGDRDLLKGRKLFAI